MKKLKRLYRNRDGLHYITVFFCWAFDWNGTTEIYMKYHPDKPPNFILRRLKIMNFFMFSPLFHFKSWRLRNKTKRLEKILEEKELDAL